MRGDLEHPHAGQGKVVGRGAVRAEAIGGARAGGVAVLDLDRLHPRASDPPPAAK
jgi:hypothetical protein